MTEPRDEDALWREIVDNFGERAEVDAEPEAAAPAESPGHPEPLDGLPEAWHPAPDPGFVPPRPGPVALPRGPRLVAWLGIAVPVVLLVLGSLTGLDLPYPLGHLLVAWLVGGFLYLVATMPRGPRDPWDDGSRV